MKSDDMPAHLLRWANGNVEAQQFLLNVAAWVRLADNIADGDSKDPVADMGELLYRLNVTQPDNEFFQQHRISLTPLISNAIILWNKSEDWKRDPNRKVRMMGFVEREAIGHLIHTVATICGGYLHALAVAEEVMAVCFAAWPETFEQWEAE